MAFARLQALDAFLASLKDAPNFQTIAQEQCVQVCREISELQELDMTEGTTLLVMIQQNTHWTPEHRNLLRTAVQNKVASTMARTSGPRSQQQDFQSFPLYLTRADWGFVMDEHSHILQKVERIMSRLYLLTLRSPSEETMGMVTTCVLLNDVQRFADGIQLRASYLQTKTMIRAFLKKKKDAANGNDTVSGTPMLVLPADPEALPLPLRQQVFGDGSPGPLPQGIAMGNLMELMTLLPLRGTRTVLQVYPKQLGPPMMPARGGHVWYAPPANPVAITYGPFPSTALPKACLALPPPPAAVTSEATPGGVLPATSPGRPWKLLKLQLKWCLL